MSRKLVLPGRFNQPVGATITLPYPQEALAATITVMWRKDGRVEVSGAVGNLEFALALLAHGATRLQRWHQQQAEALGKRMEVEVPPAGESAHGADVADPTGPEQGTS